MSEPRDSEPGDSALGRSLRRGVVTAAIQAGLVALALIVTGLTPWNLTSSPEGTLSKVLAFVAGAYGVLGAGVVMQAAPKDPRARDVANQLILAGGIVGLIYLLAQLQLTASSETLVQIVVGVLYIGTLLQLGAAAPRWLRHRPVGCSE